MKSYLDLVRLVLDKGKVKNNRTGVKALTIAGAMLQHNMNEGFPLLTTKKMAFKSMKVELEFFIKGLSDKSWLQDRSCKIWNEWCSPIYLSEQLNDAERKKKQLTEMDLGPIYGVQWRNFGGKTLANLSNDNSNEEKVVPGVDQLKDVVSRLKKDPNDRRLLVSAWNPLEIEQMALPPCHVLFHLVAIEKELNLTWFQRSCDLMLGIPFNLSSYALLLHLLCLESDMRPGVVTGMLSDVHIYENHINAAKEQLKRKPLPLPKIETQGFTNLFDWEWHQSRLIDYQSHESIAFEVAV